MNDQHEAGPLWDDARINKFIGTSAGYLRWEVEDFLRAMRDEYEARIAELQQHFDDVERQRDRYMDACTSQSRNATETWQHFRRENNALKADNIALTQRLAEASEWGDVPVGMHIGKGSDIEVELDGWITQYEDDYFRGRIYLPDDWRLQRRTAPAAQEREDE